MQVLNVALGGGIEQHLADPEGIHRGEPGAFVGHEVDVVAEHPARLDPRRERRRCARTTIRASPRSRDRFTASAHAADGVVEAAEVGDREFCLAVLWHPEEDLQGGGARLYEALVEAARDGEGRRVSLSDFEPAPTKIVATHLSYRSRCEEYKMAAPPQYPSYFLKPLNTISTDGAEVVRPRGCRFLNYEGEIALVIGKRAHGVSQDEALDHVAGYTVANDFGVHDFRHIDRGSMLRVKGQDGFCPLGSQLVDAADVDPADLTVRTFVNGEQVQEGHTGTDLLFPFAYQVADVSRLITLEPGDILLTGTPGELAPGRARRRRRGRGRGHRPDREHDRRVRARPRGRSARRPR